MKGAEGMQGVERDRRNWKGQKKLEGAEGIEKGRRNVREELTEERET